MKKQFFIIGATILVLLLIFSIFPKKGAVMEVKSDDGMATLTVAKNALPKGVRVEDLEIKKIVNTDADVLAAYELLPDGTEFSKEASLEFTIDQASNIVPIIIHQSKDGASLIDNIAITIDVSKNSTTIRTPIAHFSKIYAKNGLFILDIPDITDQIVDIPFEYKVSVEQQLDVRVQIWPTEDYPLIREDGNNIVYNEFLLNPNDWHMSASAVNYGLLVPPEIENFPATDPIIGPKYESSREFTCYESSPPSATINYHPFIYYKVDVNTRFADGTTKFSESSSNWFRMDVVYVPANTFKCISRSFEEVKTIDGITADWYEQSDLEGNLEENDEDFSITSQLDLAY